MKKRIMMKVYEGFGASIVKNTDDLFKLVRSYQPSLILLDFALEALSGGAWCMQLKAFKIRPVTTLITIILA